MKKIIFAIAMIMIAATASAQLIKSTSVSVQKGQKKNFFAIELGTGFYTGDVEHTGVALDLALRDTYMFHPNIGWDILKVNVQTDTKNFGDFLDLQVKTGVRGVTPILFGQSTAYLNAGFGYHYWIGDAVDSDYYKKGAFAWEVGAGLNITPNVLVGVQYASVRLNEQKIDLPVGNATVGTFTFRVGYQF